ncbi:type 1 fimbrial protein [Salmonella enterica]|uniref:fimbrial protein n=1 Tax=Escherichia coli TaxID=562 RepID=UPI00127538EA|nr:fimbrial protein [Escherichia coli]EBA5852080.1 type 1 fimbrial protein [Salmonella enterica]EDR3611388.1 type 1 fimbrial protein [Salmonella enterica subsp. enterica serovar Weltevreden]EBA5861314.1 type 1 fimbrial protein [Salmonella enterica]EBN0784240.1 type 1 fimbrial protein [Salmonella enterica]EBQ5709562.1 type 1 fimbrial protein [Salmonella enterica]
MIKTVIAGAFTMALVSLGANAANQGAGVINFKGTVINAPCGIAPESADQSIDFGQISKSHLEASGTSVKKNLDIKLVNCDATELATTGGVKVSFTGTTINTQIKELGTAGDTGTAVVVSEASGNLVSFDGTAGAATKLQAGDNTLRYSTWVKKATGGNLKEGDFTAVANFNLTYE